MTDAELVAEVRAGDEDAFARLVERHHETCRRLARHLLGEPSDAEDAVQETFVRAYRGIRGYRERESFRAWLLQILVNRCRTAAVRRGERRQRFVHDDGALERASTTGDTGRVDASLRLERALEGLDLEHRAAFLLKVGEDLEYDEIAHLTGASVAALKMRVKRARDHIRARWLGERT